MHGFNSIATLVFHTNYYVDAVIKVLHGEALNAHDKFSFNTPIIESEEDWQALVNKAFIQAEEFALLIEQLPEEKLWQNIADEKYGIYYRNIHGIIEHNYYHLGQIALIKKLVEA
ncbi:MAG: DUF1572 domain-containing protein [Bacteroidia bacterium]